MGNQTEILDHKKECIIWIDANIYNEENKETYKSHLKTFQNFNFICFSSVQSATNFIYKQKYFN